MSQTKTDIADSEKIQIARQGWKMLEPYHAMIYFAPEARELYKQAGLKGFWMGYFASRAAPLGAVSAEIVTACFYNFKLEMVARAIPDAWRFSTPEEVLAARLQAADLALRRLLGDEIIASPGLAEAAELARQATGGCSLAGRPLFAAYAAMQWPEQPHLILWHAATLLREYRGDGHNAALLVKGLDALAAHWTIVANGVVPRENLQPHRGWTDEEWNTAYQQLVARGWLAEDGKLSEAGRQVRQEVEVLTDELASAPWQALGESGCNRLFELMQPICTRIVEREGIPVPNPMGLPWP